MRSSYFLLCTLLVITGRSHASYPAEAVEEEPAVAIAPAPVIEEIAPAPLPEPEIVAPAPVVAPAGYVKPAPVVVPAPVVEAEPVHHYHPRTEVRNVATAYKKESHHRSDTVMVSGDEHDFDHFPSSLEFFPHDHFFDHAGYPVPLRARVNRKKLASKKAAKARKTIHGSYPAAELEEEPAVAIAPAPVIEEIAPAPLPEPEIIAPAPVVAPAEYVKPAPVIAPAPVVEAEPVHHHHPRTEVRNVATAYQKVSRHRSDTVMVSGDDHHFGHFPSSLEFLPHEHFFDHDEYPVPLRARVNRKKLASKKAAKARKTFEKKKN
ncbi:hypothetical protein ANCCEY_04839 [Ancylostoma ceylanicum]|uniref:Uncharacterized protein n=1 Tax=Ancylostoma ceylanicum TaxID=53326 RepID=A0A0D6M140_9BILA|nr:hypothetical protein ANCCEY_04839 [Ancylostoma ceylanicum]